MKLTDYLAARQDRSLHQADCEVEELTLNGPPCCTNPSFWERCDLFEVKRKEKSSRLGGQKIEVRGKEGRDCGMMGVKVMEKPGLTRKCGARCDGLHQGSL